METARRSTVVGVFDESDRARDAIQALKDSGFAASDISILMKDHGQAREMAEDTGTRAGEGAVTGAVGGGILGGLAGWLVGIGALTIPGVGPVIAAGAFGTALAGAGMGAGMGAIAGALIGMGIPTEEAEWYEGEVQRGRTLITVKAGDRYAEAHSILSHQGAYDIENRYTSTAIEGGTGVPTWSEGQVLPPSTRSGGPEDEVVPGSLEDREGVPANSYPEHEHSFVGDVCEICGATRPDRRAA